METSVGLPNDELDPSYAGEFEYGESYSETDPEHIENDEEAPNVMLNEAGLSHHQNSRGAIRQAPSWLRG